MKWKTSGSCWATLALFHQGRVRYDHVWGGVHYGVLVCVCVGLKALKSLMKHEDVWRMTGVEETDDAMRTECPAAFGGGLELTMRSSLTGRSRSIWATH